MISAEQVIEYRQRYRLYGEKIRLEVCVNYQAGNCGRGQTCPFIHGITGTFLSILTTLLCRMQKKSSWGCYLSLYSISIWKGMVIPCHGHCRSLSRNHAILHDIVPSAQQKPYIAQGEKVQYNKVNSHILDGKSIIREKLVGEQECRVHANFSVQGRICCERENIWRNKALKHEYCIPSLIAIATACRGCN